MMFFCVPRAAAAALFIFLHHCLLLPVSVLSVNQTAALVPAVIVFGDSIVDPGNNNVMRTIVKSNFPPYGKDFIGHSPTGRFCNGKIPTDFIASTVGVKELLPAYLGTTLGPEDLLTGVSFASSGSGFDPLTPTLTSVLSLPDQLELFKEYKKKVRGIAGKKRANSIISASLYVVCAGSDDIANNYFLPSSLRQHSYDFSSYAKFLVHKASGFVEDLVNLGARSVAVVGIPPIGCVPSQRTLGGGIMRSCASGHNQVAQLYNSGLKEEMQRLKTKHQGTKLVYVDIYTILLNMILHPNAYGFEVSAKGCCGTGDLEVSVLCNGLTTVTCADASKYVFWDSFHPTERAYEILVDWVLKTYLPYLL
ncbi:unnamed protein product [Musa banksii]